MTSVSPVPTWSPSVSTALLWASGCADLRGTGQPVGSADLFVGLLLAHPDRQAEVWGLLDHFGLTARDLLPDDFPVVDSSKLSAVATAAHGPDPSTWDPDVSTVMLEASLRAGGIAQIIHVLAALLTLTPWQDRLQAGVARFGIDAGDVVRGLEEILPGEDDPSPSGDSAAQTLNLRSGAPAGTQLREWLAQRFPRRPATMASFSSDVPNPEADFVGVSAEADAFAYLIASRNLIPPLAIGLFGPWGSGKSFLMAKIRQRVSQLAGLAATPDESASDDIWTKIVPIEFNAWQYVEADLWAALLSRIFDELSPEAREKLTLLGVERRRVQREQDQNLDAQLRAEEATAELVVKERVDAAAVTDAGKNVDAVRVQVEALREVAVSAALSDHARSTAAEVLVGGLATTLDPLVADAVKDAQDLRTAARSPVWRQGKFWTPARVVWVSLALLVFPVAVLVLDRRGIDVPAALATALPVVAAVLFPLVRAATAFTQAQEQRADEAASAATAQLSGLIQAAEKARDEKVETLKKTREQIEERTQESLEAAGRRADLDQMAARLNAGGVYADFLAGRDSSADYRGRLSIVSAVSEDLKTLSSLVTEYNDSDEAQRPDGPPNRIVLYIDDLDRCPPSRVVEVLEAVHLLLAFPLFVVVVAVDTRWLTAALQEALPVLQGDDRRNGDAPTTVDYLEKIFQLPFWVEPLDVDGRHRLLRGLLLPSVAPADTDGDSLPVKAPVLNVGDAEMDAAITMLAVHGPWLDRDAKAFSITPAELAFIESLNPLLTGTPRQVKRFLNVCKLLLAMSPPLSAGDGVATQRTVACFMAAVHQSMPAFATRLAEVAADASPESTLASLVPGIVDPDLATDRQKVQEWLKEAVPALPATPFGEAQASTLLLRWDVIRRLHFGSGELASPVQEPAGGARPVP